MSSHVAHVRNRRDDASNQTGQSTARAQRRRDSDVQQQTERPRLQLEFTPEAHQRLQELKSLIGARTNAEVIRKALHVLDFVVTNTKDDYRLRLVKGDVTREIELVL